MAENDMGVDYAVYMAAGVKLTKAVSKGSVTRYHEKTGEAYQKEEYVTHWVAPDGWKITDERLDELVENYDERCVISDNCENNGDIVIVGHHVRILNGEVKTVIDFPSAEIQRAAIDKAREKLTPLLYTGDINLYAVLYCSY